MIEKIKSGAKTGVIALILGFVFITSYSMHYYLPKSNVVTITGVSSKRLESTPVRNTEADPAGIDVYFVMAKQEDGQATIFKNEDTNWGVPLYFKFNSAELQSKANGITNEKAIVSYYGWRNKFFGTFPNILSIESFEGDVPGISWLRTSAFLIWWTICLVFFVNMSRIFAKGRDKKAS